jgi:formyltetrahydrofolate hydrolase
MGARRGQEFVLTLSCPDKPGIVYAVASFLVQHSANILASQQYGESPDGRFFMRVHFSVPPRGVQLAELERGFSWVAEAFHMSWQLHDTAARVRTLIMVSRLGHCLNDLLFRWKTGSLPVGVVGVVSNHDDFAELAASYRLPFHYIPVTPQTKAAAETQLLDVIVLARYMQILSGIRMSAKLVSYRPDRNGGTYDDTADTDRRTGHGACREVASSLQRRPGRSQPGTRSRPALRGRRLLRGQDLHPA